MIKNFIIGVIVLFSVGFVGLFFVPGLMVTKIANNSLSAYSAFYELHQSHVSNLSRIVAYRKNLQDAETEDEKMRTRIELNAVQQTCRNIVAKYNADSSKFQLDMFKSNNLPYRLDINHCN